MPCRLDMSCSKIALTYWIKFNLSNLHCLLQQVLFSLKQIYLFFRNLFEYCNTQMENHFSCFFCSFHPLSFGRYWNNGRSTQAVGAQGVQSKMAAQAHLDSFQHFSIPSKYIHVLR